MHKGRIVIACLVLLCLASTASFASEAIERKYQEMGGSTGPLGAPVTPVYSNPDERGFRQHYAQGSIYWSPTTGAYAILSGPFWDTWAAHGWEQGLGYPVTDEVVNPDNVGHRQHFQQGQLYWHPDTGAWAVLNGPFWAKWSALGWEGGTLGYPVTDEIINPDNVGRRQHFQQAQLYWNGQSDGGNPLTGVYAVLNGPFWDTWGELGWEQGLLGYPRSDEYSDPACGTDGRRMDFEHGSLCWTPSTGKVVTSFTGDTACPYGMPWCNRCANDIEGVFQQSPFTVTGRFKYQTALAGAPHYSTHWKERWHDHIQGVVRLPESTGKPLFVYTRSRPRDPFRCFLDEWSVPIDQCRSETGFFLVEMDGVDEQGNQGHAMQSGTQRSDRIASPIARTVVYATLSASTILTIREGCRASARPSLWPHCARKRQPVRGVRLLISMTCRTGTRVGPGTSNGSKRPMSGHPPWPSHASTVVAI